MSEEREEMTTPQPPIDGGLKEAAGGGARERVLTVLREKYPDKSFEDDEELFGAIGDDYDGYARDADELGRFREDDKKLREMMSREPRNAQLLIDVYNGGDPIMGLIKRYGTEIRDVLDDPEAQEKIAEANKEYVDRLAESEKLEDEYKTNLDQSIETLRSFKEENGMTDEEADAVFNGVMQVVRDGLMGKFSAATLGMFRKAMTRDADVASAREEGEVAGRNARITERLRKAGMGDGTSPLGGSNNAADFPAARKSIFELAREARR